MTDIETRDLENVVGGSWQDVGAGILCGAGIVVLVATAVSPEPVSKLGWWSLALGTADLCYSAFT